MVSSNGSLAVKIGLTVGEPVEDSDDLFGASVNLAARICAHAAGSQTLASGTVRDLAAEVEIPQDGTLSRVLYKDDQIRLVAFGFDAGQELTDHTAAVAAIVEVVSGQLRVGLGDEFVELAPGSWVHMPANLKHSVFAIEPSVMLLTLLKRSG